MASTAADRVSAKLKDFGASTSANIKEGVEFAKKNPIMTGAAVFVFILLVSALSIVYQNNKASIEVKTKEDQEKVDKALSKSKSHAKFILFLIVVGAGGVFYLKSKGYAVTKL